MKIELEFNIYMNIREVDQKLWDSINITSDVFHSYQFLCDLEDAKVENCTNWYLLIYSQKNLVSTVVLSSFSIDLSVFIESNALVALVRKLWRNFMKINILMCGIPASFGQRNIVFKNDAPVKDILALVSQIMNDISKKYKIKFLAYKEFKQEEIDLFDSLKSHGYFRALSLPNMKMNIRWETFNSYLMELRHGYKRQILRSIKKLSKGNGSLLEKKILESLGDKPELIILNNDQCTSEIFLPLYLKVMERASSKLETFNLDFFRHFFKSHNDSLVFIAIADRTTIHGLAVLVSHGDNLTFSLIGKSAEKDEYDTYFNIITGIVKYAIDQKYTTLNMGQTSYYPKTRMGALDENEFIYFKSKNRFVHLLLRILNPIVFPKTKLQKLEVFKSK
jgi:predicted N-acyltransferase